MGLISMVIVAIMGALATLIGAIIVSTASKILADDARAWLPWITRRLLARAVRHLPEELRERFFEEWSSHLDDIPGDLAKIYVAWGYLSGSREISSVARVGPGPVFQAVVRAADVVGASILLLLSIPLLALVAVIIKLDSNGPVFYKKRRSGRNGKVFTFYSFRTITEVKWLDSATSDLRVTRIGRFLRRSSYDEFPGLLNVLRGDMSLFGPRANAADLKGVKKLERKPGLLRLPKDPKY